MPSKPLRRLLSFVKSTIVGGVFVLVPLVLLSIVVGESVRVAHRFVEPLVQMLPVTTVGTVSLALLLGIAAVVFCCFLAGLLARTAVSQWFVNHLEHLILAFIPSYGLMKSMGQGWIGAESEATHQSVLVRLDDAYQLGFRMDTLPDGRCVVFIPDVPAPWSGSLLIVSVDRLEPIPLTTRQTIDCLRKLGANASKLWPSPQSP